jgi:hypothetical protein
MKKITKNNNKIINNEKLLCHRIVSGNLYQRTGVPILDAF